VGKPSPTECLPLNQQCIQVDGRELTTFPLTGTLQRALPRGTDSLFVAVGCSGHGFKLAPTMSESLAQMILDLEPRIPIDDYSVSRLAKE